jgi:hypothetical protein
VWIVAPTFKVADEDWSLAGGVLDLAKQAGVVANVNLSERRLWVPHGGLVEVRTAQREENLRGGGVDLLAVDEGAQVPEPMWTSALQPVVWDRQGRVLLGGTPRGRNWFYRIWRKGADGEPGFAAWQMASDTNPNLPDTARAEAQASMPADIFRQEFLAEFLESAAEVFPGLEHCILADAGAVKPQPGHGYVHGLDLARKHDFTVHTVLDITVSPIRLVRFERVNGIAYDTQATQTAPTMMAYGGPVWGDATGVGDAALEMWELRGIPVTRFVITPQSKGQLIGRLRKAIESGLLRIPDSFTTVINELRDFDLTLGPTGNERYGAPEGLFDDCVMSLALAWWGYERGGSTFNRESSYVPPRRR